MSHNSFIAKSLRFIGIVLMVAGYFLYQSNPAFQASVKKLMGKLS